MKKNLVVIDERIVLGEEFRIYGDFENPLFMAKDVAEWIEYPQGNISNMLRTVDEEEKLKLKTLIAGQGRETMFLTEDGLYEVLMQSRKPIAKQFKKQVKEILKSIRKHGAYMTENTLEQVIANPHSMIDLINTLKQEQEARLQAEKEIAELKEIVELQAPKVQKYNEFLEADGTISIEVFAKTLSLKVGKKQIGRNDMFKLLRRKGILTRNNTPKQYYLNKGLFEVSNLKLLNNEIVPVTRITPLGADYLMNLLL